MNWLAQFIRPDRAAPPTPDQLLQLEALAQGSCERELNLELLIDLIRDGFDYIPLLQQLIATRPEMTPILGELAFNHNPTLWLLLRGPLLALLPGRGYLRAADMAIPVLAALVWGHPLQPEYVSPRDLGVAVTMLLLCRRPTPSQQSRLLNLIAAEAVEIGVDTVYAFWDHGLLPTLLERGSERLVWAIEASAGLVVDGWRLIFQSESTTLLLTLNRLLLGRDSSCPADVNSSCPAALSRLNLAPYLLSTAEGSFRNFALALWVSSDPLTVPQQLGQIAAALSFDAAIDGAFDWILNAVAADELLLIWLERNVNNLTPGNAGRVLNLLGGYISRRQLKAELERLYNRFLTSGLESVLEMINTNSTVRSN